MESKGPTPGFFYVFFVAHMFARFMSLLMVLSITLFRAEEMTNLHLFGRVEKMGRE